MLLTYTYITNKTFKPKTFFTAFVVVIYSASIVDKEIVDYKVVSQLIALSPCLKL